MDPTSDYHDHDVDPPDATPERDPDPRKWSKAEIVASLNRLPIPSCTLHVHRADRHDLLSPVQALTLTCDGVLTFDAITQIAGLFETPHITFEPKGSECECTECTPATIEIIVKWEAPVPVSKVASPTPLPTPNTLPYRCPIDGSAPACIDENGKTARELFEEHQDRRAHRLPHDDTGWQP